MRKIGIIGGAGNLGAMIGYNLAIEELADEIILIDLLEDKAKAQAHDISHGIAWEKETSVTQGSYEDAEGADLFVITAGKPREPGMSRLDLIDANKNIMKSVAENIDDVAPEAVSVTTTNPIDIMNFALYHYGNRSREKVIGEAGMLDSARFRYVLAQKFGVKMTNVEAFIIGEHGDSQVPLFSRVKVNEEKKVIKSSEERREILKSLQGSAMRVIENKGATIFGPARGVTLMIKNILNDKRETYPCSVIPNGEYGLESGSIGLPTKLGSNGIEEIIEWSISDGELEMLRKSHEKILGICQEEISLT
ncbi:MAG: malate dehydrogenase [Hadesarchaea archaeon]|nr:malate dehydrogenase [Hadesarchaea archaeon]